MKLNPRLLYESVGNDGGQTIRYQALYNVTEAGAGSIGGPRTRRLCVTIRSNAYRDQSSAKVQVYGKSKWHEIAALATGEIETEIGLYTRKDVAADYFTADRQALLKLADLILNGGAA